LRSHDVENRARRHSSDNIHGSSRHRSARELADAELQRAIQLSLQEANSATGHARPGYVPSQPSPSLWRYSEPPLVDNTTRPNRASSREEDDDPDLRAAIEASLREANAPKPSAPLAVDTPRIEPASYGGRQEYAQSYPPNVIPRHPSPPKLPSYDLEPLETDAILTFSQTVEQAQAHGGRDISRYPAMTELYDKANSLRPKLAMNLDDTGRKERE
jgi:hepatocyte growth factor-regulated tyrosine kinase substrate